MITTAEAFEVLEPEALEALLLVEEIPAFAEEVADQLADDWCRTQLSIEEIAERQRLAGVAIAPVVCLPIPASQFKPPEPLRRAA